MSSAVRSSAPPSPNQPAAAQPLGTQRAGTSCPCDHGADDQPFEPDPANQAVYLEARARQRRLYQRMAGAGGLDVR